MRKRAARQAMVRLVWRVSKPGAQEVAELRHVKKRFLYDMLDLAELPPGQRRAVEALFGGDQAQTYVKAANAAGMSEGTLLTHINRVRSNHPELYRSIRRVRRSQLAVRHRVAVENAKAHSRAYFRRVNRQMRLLLGYNPWRPW